MRPDQARLAVTLTVGHKDHTQSVTINGPMLEAFVPIDVCSDSFTQSFISRTAPKDLRRKMQQRPEYAKYLATKLAELILATMESQDQVDGYPKEPK